MVDITRVKKKVGGFLFLCVDLTLYVKHKVLKSNYAKYYAERMDRRITRNSKWGLTQDKGFQLIYLMQHGLLPTSDFLDYGAGALAAGVHFIEYLDEGCYTGVDVSEKVLIEGLKRVNDKGLDGKKPKLQHLPSGDLGRLVVQKFDYIWAQSVLTHMPPTAIEYLFQNIKKYMTDESQIFANFKKSSMGVKQKMYRDWQYDYDSIAQIISSCGMKCEFMEDWEHPYDEANSDTMIRISLN